MEPAYSSSVEAIVARVRALTTAELLALLIVLRDDFDLPDIGVRELRRPVAPLPGFAAAAEREYEIP